MKNNIKASQCFECKHFNEDKAFTCKAFPEGIPDVLLYSKISHKKPFKDDNGIQFEVLK